MRLRILHVITGLTRGGAETMLQRLLAAMPPQDFEQRVLCLGPEAPLALELRTQGIQTLCLDLRGGPSAALRLAGAIATTIRWRPHILQGWMYHGNLAALLIHTLSGRRSALAWNVRVGIDTLATYRPGTRALIRLGARLSGSADRIIFNAASARTQHEALGYHRDRAILIPNGFDLEAFRPCLEARRSVRRELGIPEGAPLLGQFARFHPEKNQALFLTALAGLPREVHGVLAGQGIHEGNPDLRKALMHPGLEGRVHLLGERTDMPRLTAALDLAVSPSWNEGFSNALGEALACGVPCVATDVGDSAALVGPSGALVPAGDAEALGHAIARLLSQSAEARSAMGEDARRRVEANWGIRSVAGQYENLYRTLAASS